jgi:hypothetical protein
MGIKCLVLANMCETRYNCLNAWNMPHFGEDDTNMPHTTVCRISQWSDAPEEGNSREENQCKLLHIFSVEVRMTAPITRTVVISTALLSSDQTDLQLLRQFSHLIRVTAKFSN